MKLIALVDENWGLAQEGRQVFLIPEDLAYFKQVTLGNVVVMGRRTLEALPGQRPLPGRDNIVLTRQAGLLVPEAAVCHSLAALRQVLAGLPGREVFVIGGAEVYRQLLPYCGEALITKVYADGKADAFLSNLDAEPGWRPAAQPVTHTRQDMPDYAFCLYCNSSAKIL